AAQGVLDVVESAGSGRVVAILRPAEQDHGHQVVGVVVLDVLQGAVDAELGQGHGDVLGRAGVQPGVGQVLDQRHGSEPKAVARPFRVVGGGDVELAGRVLDVGAADGHAVARRCAAAGKVATDAARRPGRVLDVAVRVAPDAD